MATSRNPADHPFPLIRTPTSTLPNGVKPDMFYRCASGMACAHNIIIRGLNSIYLQAPYIQPEDEGAFLRYCACFYEFTHIHNTGEEEDLFPTIEEMSGVRGIMDRNIAQHYAFKQGLDEYSAYIAACLRGVQKYNGDTLVGIIDVFGNTLTTHLTEEISTILNLARYGDRMAKLEKRFKARAKEDTSQLLVTSTRTWAFFNHDKEYEDGLWKNWPQVPALAAFTVRRVTYWFHADWWKFTPCDPWGKPRDTLYAVPQNAW
ncbi:hypothetical protein ACJ41O_000218 [Fusarium nematophilum]